MKKIFWIIIALLLALIILGLLVFVNKNSHSEQSSESFTKPDPVIVYYMLKDQLAGVEVDLAYNLPQYQKYTNLIIVSDKIKFSNNGGLDKSETERQNKFSHDLGFELASNSNDFVFVGDRGADPVGYNTIYFYAKDYSIIPIIQKVASQSGNQTIISTSTDPNWLVYKEKLYPSEERQNWLFKPGAFDSRGNPVKVNLKGEVIN